MGISLKGFNKSSLKGIKGKPPEAMAAKYNVSVSEYVRGSALVNNPQGDPYWNNVVLAFPANGIDHATTYDVYAGDGTPFVTSSGLGNEITTSEFKYGGSSYFSDNASHLYSNNSLRFNMNSDDFTTECWYKPIAKGGNYPRVWQTGIGPFDNWSSSFLDRHNDWPTKFIFTTRILNGVNPVLESTTTVTDGVWYHLAVTRESGVFRLFINGVLEDTNSNYIGQSVTSDSQAITTTIGGCHGNRGGEQSYGYIDDFRMTKGIARYTETFTIPSSAYPIG